MMLGTEILTVKVSVVVFLSHDKPMKKLVPCSIHHKYTATTSGHILLTKTFPKSNTYSQMNQMSFQTLLVCMKGTP